MRVRYARLIVIAALLGSWLAGAAAQPPAAPPPKGDADFRAAWVAFAAPAADPEKSQSLEARQQARLAAIPLMEAAIAADSRNWIYQESLAYICLTAGQYEKAKAAVEKAIGIKRDRPVLYLLRGQAEAALAQMDPPNTPTLIGPAVDAFDRAAKLDPYNALPLLQGASVAYDASRPDLAAARVKQALQRTGSMLYTLSVPSNLFDDRGAAIRAWQYIQLGHWYELLARFRNVNRHLLARGERLEQRKELGAADESYRSALQVGRLVAGMSPHLFINVNAGIDMMEDSYHALARVANATGNKDEQRWKGEAGVVEFARSQLVAALGTYAKEIAKNPAPTIEELLVFEDKIVAPVIAGIGLNPNSPGTPAGRAKPEGKTT